VISIENPCMEMMISVVENEEMGEKRERRIHDLILVVSSCHTYQSVWYFILHVVRSHLENK